VPIINFVDELNEDPQGEIAKAATTAIRGQFHLAERETFYE
jgi:hypothetical protein